MKPTLIFPFLFLSIPAFPQSIPFPAKPGMSTFKYKPETKQDTIIYWNENRKLTWDDFKGAPPSDTMSIYGAATTSTITIDYVCNDTILVYLIRAWFSKNKSWVREKGKTPEILRHEQLHFDITELYARKIRKSHKMFLDAVKGYKKIDCDKFEIQLQIGTMIKQMEEYEHRVYDLMTLHGLAEQAQADYEREIQNRLNELSAFKANPF